MQELLQMMRKITAEPNNNARPQAVPPTQQIVPIEQEPADVDATDNTDATSGQQEPSSIDKPADSKVRAVDDENSALVAADNVGSLSQIDESAIEDIVEEAAGPVVQQGGGLIKRWINKAVSWIKRLIGF